jgi:SAM-dependent methyltransferase
MNCPACGSADTRFSCEVPVRPFEKEGTGIESITYLWCGDCSLAFHTSPMIDTYYQEAYRRNLPAHCEAVREGNVRGEHKRAAKMDEHLMLWGVVPKTVLDVGSATGELLRYMQQKYSCWVVGVEPSDAFREYANQHDTRTLANITEIDRKFELVTCVHVLEHIADPMPFLASIKEKVERYLYLEVPFLSPKLPHALMFTLDSLVGLMERAGFKVVHKELSDKDNNARVLCAPG